MKTGLQKKRRTSQESSFSKITPSQMRGIFLTPNKGTSMTNTKAEQQDKKLHLLRRKLQHRQQKIFRRNPDLILDYIYFQYKKLQRAA